MRTKLLRIAGDRIDNNIGYSATAQNRTAALRQNASPAAQAGRIERIRSIPQLDVHLGCGIVRDCAKLLIQERQGRVISWEERR